MNRRTLLLGGSAFALVGASPRRRYLKEHRGFTRELVLYFDIATALILRATLLEPAFRAVVADERRRLMDPSAEDHAAFVARMQADGAAFFDVVFAADSAFDNATKFGPGDDRWNLRLEADGAEQPFVQVDRVRRPSPLHEALYAQTNQWSELWIARWQRLVPAPGTVVLHVGGGFGNGDCVWQGLRG